MHIHFSRSQLPKAGVAVAVAFAALTVWNLARIALLARSTDTGKIAAPAPKTDTTGSRSSVQRILQSGWLGHPDGSVPQSSLPFTLKGTYAGTDGRGYAIIADTHGKTAVYATGSELPGRVRIKAVQAHRVLLSTTRGEESLPLHEPVAAHASFSGNGGGPANARRSGPAGLAVTTHTPSVLVHALHLRPGDTVIAVNGKPMASRVDVLGLLRSVPPGAPVKLRVRRDGRNLTLDVRAPMPGMLDHMEP
jgi:type II secretory pathway component PulC